MSLATHALGSGRRLAESLMVTTVKVQRAGEPVRNPEAGSVEPSMTAVYEGKARVRFPSSQPRETDHAGQRTVEQHPTVWLPITVTDVRLDDIGTVTANPPDPGIVGMTFRIVGLHAQTHSTSRRFPVEILSFA